MSMAAGHHDKDTLIATAIAELLYPEAEHREEGMPYEDYAELARRCYQKEYTTPLRAAAPVTEVRICPSFVCVNGPTMHRVGCESGKVACIVPEQGC